eukprot:GAHX01008325.1.p1 GENE.GAHX01008325.1~~GAHX01008325.1.p1  ORF type:complete len:60 (+),score=0.38 GAHX01008325.1:64-243(+)
MNMQAYKDDGKLSLYILVRCNVVPIFREYLIFWMSKCIFYANIVLLINNFVQFKFKRDI